MKNRAAWMAVVVLTSFGTAAQADPVPVAVAGIVEGSPENVSFQGSARVASRLAPDPDFGRPRLVLTFDLTGVAGTGMQTGATYVVHGPEIVQRVVAATHSVAFLFPFNNTGTNDTSRARSGSAAFQLTFNTATGAITNATATIGTFATSK